MPVDPIEKLVQIGFSEYEAKAYVALLRKNPITGYELSKISGVPRSMIYEVLGKLTSRGAAMTLVKEGATRYAPVPAEEFLDHLLEEYQEVIGALKKELTTLVAAADLEYVWNIDGHENIMAKAEEMINQAQTRIYLALLPDTFPALYDTLAAAIERKVRVVLYSPTALDLTGGRVVVTPISEEALGQAGGLGLVLAIDGEEVLIAEWLTEDHARASWTRSPLFVFVAEHHLRTDLYLPHILALLGDQAIDIIDKEDRDLFAHALESYIDHS